MRRSGAGQGSGKSAEKSAFIKLNQLLSGSLKVRINWRKTSKYQEIKSVDGVPKITV